MKRGSERLASRERSVRAKQRSVAEPLEESPRVRFPSPAPQFEDDLMAFTQAPLGVENEAVVGQLKMAIDAVFTPSEVESFLRRVQKSKLRVRDFEGVLKSKLLKDREAAALYAQLSPSDAGQIREHYLQQLEQVDPKLREKFKKLYSYY